MRQDQIDRLHELNEEFAVIVRKYTDLLFLMNTEKDSAMRERLRLTFISVRRDMWVLTEEQLKIIEEAKGQTKVNTNKVLMMVLVLAVLLWGSMGVVAQDGRATEPADLPTLEITSDVVIPVESPVGFVTVTPGGDETPVVEPTLPPVEPEPPVVVIDGGFSRMEIVIIGVMLVLTALLSLFGVAFVSFGRSLLASTPQWVATMLQENARRGFDQLNEFTALTPTDIDDQMAARIKQIVMQVFAENATAATTEVRPPDDSPFSPN